MPVIHLKFETRKPTLKFDPARRRRRTQPQRPAPRARSRRETIIDTLRDSVDYLTLDDTDQTLLEGALRIVADVLDRNLPRGDHRARA